MSPPHVAVELVVSFVAFRLVLVAGFAFALSGATSIAAIIEAVFDDPHVFAAVPAGPLSCAMFTH